MNLLSETLVMLVSLCYVVASRLYPQGNRAAHSIEEDLWTETPPCCRCVT